MAIYPIIDGQKPDSSNAIPPHTPDVRSPDGAVHNNTTKRAPLATEEGDLIDLGPDCEAAEGVNGAATGDADTSRPAV